MILESSTARQNNDYALIEAKKTFKIEVTDALFIDYKKRCLLAIKYKNIRLPICSIILEDISTKDYFLSFKGLSCIVFIENNEIRFLTSDMDEHVLPSNIKNLIKESIKSIANYGGEIDKDGNLVYDLKSKDIGPHYAVNLLLGDRSKFIDPLLSTPKSVVDKLGHGSFRGEASYQVLATRWDLRPEENGNPFNRQFYIVENGEVIFYSGEVNENLQYGKTIHSQNFTKIIYRTKDLLVTRTIFIVPQISGLPEATEAQTIEIKNCSKNDRKLSIICVGMFGLSNPDCAKNDIIYQTVINESKVIKNENNEIVAISPNYYPVYFKDYARFAIIKDDNGFSDEFTNNCTEFLGNGDINRPEGINNFSNSLRTSGASFFALKKNLNIRKQGTSYIDTFVGAAKINAVNALDNILENRISNLINKFKTHEDLRKEFNCSKRIYQKYSSFINVKTNDNLFDSYINSNLPFQVLYQTFVSRSFAQTQKGYREIGFREIQDLYASTSYLVAEGKANLAKELLLNWVKNVYEFGYVNHNFYYEGKEPGMCSDDGLWLVDAIYRYVSLTSDYKFLTKRGKICAKDKKRSILDTLKAIITYSSKISVGKHGLPLLDEADWNDCLRIDTNPLKGPEKEKLYYSQLRKNKEKFGAPLESNYSESVMNAFLLVVAIRDMIKMSDDSNYIKELTDSLDRLTNTLHREAYINDYYVRVLINNPLNKNKYIGSKGDELSIDKNIDGSYYLNSFSWSLLSDVASEEEIKKGLDIVNKYLRTDAGFMLCSPSDLSLAGAKNSSTDHYFLGDRENGGVFKHALMMFVVSLLKKSKSIKDKSLKEEMLEAAFFGLDKVLPYKTLNNPYILKGNPRFCTQYNNSITGENIGPILSGTATWLTLALYEMVGINITNNELTIIPVLPKDTKEFNATIRFKKSSIEIRITKVAGEFIDYKNAKYFYDSKEINTNKIKLLDDSLVHQVEIIF